MLEVLLVIVCYLLGSIPFSLLIGKLTAGIDIRSRGSGNVGATNVLRTLGIKGAILALAGDALKGILAAWLGMIAGGPLIAAMCGFIAVLGHCYSVFLKFKGGKGVATSAGVMLYLMPNILLVLLVVFTAIVVLSRYVSLGSVTVAILFPLLTIIFSYPNAYVIMSFLMAIIVVNRHKENIYRLRQGTESKIGERT